MDILNAQIAYWHWIVFGICLVVMEMLVPSFFLLWLGISAIVTGIIAWLVPISITWQLLLWGTLSLVSLVLWFRLIQPKIKVKSLSGMSKEAIIGQEGMVLDFTTTTGQGHMRFTVPVGGSTEWPARSFDALSAGDKVIVTEISGNALVVRIKGTQ